MKTAPIPRVHENEVYDPPDWVFAPGVTIYAGKAAKILGMSRPTLIRYADSFGLSIFREPIRRRRRFLVSEIKALKRRMEEATIEDVLRKPGKKNRKWNGKEGWGNGLLATGKGKR